MKHNDYLTDTAILDILRDMSRDITDDMRRIAADRLERYIREMGQLERLATEAAR